MKHTLETLLTSITSDPKSLLASIGVSFASMNMPIVPDVSYSNLLLNIPNPTANGIDAAIQLVISGVFGIITQLILSRKARREAKKEAAKNK